MLPYNEDVAWLRIQDLQREMENSRLLADEGVALGRLLHSLARRIWARVEAAWPVRSVDRLHEEPDSASDVA